MKIRTKIAIWFTLIVGAILLIFALTIYYQSSKYRSQEFYTRINEKAYNTAKLFLEVDEVSTDLLRIIGMNMMTLSNEKIVIYDYNGKEIFRTKKEKEKLIDRAIIENIKTNNELRFNKNLEEGLGIVYSGKKNKIIIIAWAYDRYGYSKLRNLRLVLSIGLILSVITTMLVGWFFAGRALSPILIVIEQVDKITALNLSKRVDEGNGTDEIAHLAITFNQMLNRIEKAFELQKSFVSNASHELRTPLTSITGQLEVTLMKDRQNYEYVTTLKSVLEDIKSMNSLSNGLLDLAQANLDISKLKLKKVRIDELLWSIHNELTKRNDQNTINLNIINFPEEEASLVVLGSEQLLRTAVTNLIENACKFSSDKTCQLDFSTKKGLIILTCTDYGIGISEDEQKKILEPFYRGTNAKSFAGYGIGLSLANKIISLHKGELTIDSKLNKYTKISVTLPC